MRGSLFLLRLYEKTCFKLIFGTLLFILLSAIASAQPIAGIRANGRMMNAGDTVIVCINGTVIHETTAQNFTAIRWKFKNGTPNSGISGYQPVQYTTAGIDTSWQIVSSPLGVDSTFILVRVADIKPVADFTFSPNGQCANLPVNFNSTSSGTGLQYAWDFNDGGATSTSQPTTYQFLNAVGAPGTVTYNVTLIVTNQFQCKDSITKTVTVQKMPDASIGNADASVQFSSFNGVPTFKKCDILNGTNHTFQFLGASTTPGSIGGYSIDWGDGSPLSNYPSLPPGFIFTHNYSVGQYVLTVTALSNNGGCTGIKKYNVFFGTTPAGGLIPLPNNSICAPNTLTFPVTGTSTNAASTTYTFSVNDGSDPITYAHPSLPAAISHLFTAGSCGNLSSNGTQSFTNSFRVTLSIENACGVTSSSVIPVYVSGRPKASITAPVVVCTGVNTTILNSSLMGGTITPTGGGNSLCTNNTRQVWSITPSTGWNLTAGSLGSFNGNPGNYLVWTSGTQSLGVTFTLPGTYTIKMNVGNDCGYDEITRTICVRNAPTASFLVDTKSGCGTVTSGFTNTSPQNNGCLGEAYYWEVTYIDPSGCGGSANYSFINGSNSGSANPVIQFLNPGVYIVKLYVTANGSNGCAAFTTDTIRVKAKPKVVINPIAAVCLGIPISPTAQVDNCYSTSPLSLLWSFTNGTPASSNQLIPGVITYAGLGTHPITLEVKNECGTTTVTTNAIITTTPAADAGPDKAMCSGDSILIGSTPFAGVNYQWTPTTGIVNPLSGNPILSLTYNGPNPDTVYRYVLTASAGPTCTKNDTVFITVKKKPIVTLTPAGLPVCAGTPITLTAGGADTYSWTPTLGLNASTGPTVIATPNATTTYTVIGTLANGCSAAANVLVSILANPPVFAGNDTTVCSFSPAVQFFPSPQGGIWAGSPHLSATGLFNPATAGNGVYPLTYTVTTGGCSRVDTVIVTVINTPVVNAGNDSTFCQDNIAVQLSATPAGGRWSGSPFVTQNGVFNTSVLGTYVLIYTYGSGLCIGRDTVEYRVVAGIGNNLIGSDQAICAGTVPSPLIGQVVTGGNGSPQYQWQISTNNFVWNNIPGATFKDYSPGAISTTTWLRRLVSTITCSGLQSSSSASVKITVNPNAKAEFNPLVTSGCPPFSITSSIINVTPYSAVNSAYNWYVNGVFVGAGLNFPGYTIVNNNESATIMLIAISAYGCKNDTSSQTFIAAGTPNVNAGPDTTLCAGSAPFQLIGSPAGGRWSGSPFVSFTGLFNPFTAGTYTLIYTYGSGACLGSDTMIVLVNAGLSNNSIDAPQTICIGTAPSPLTGLPVTGGNASVTYQWQLSTNNFTWTNIAGATGQNYSPGILSQTTWYRRIANSNLCAGNTSASIKITVNPNAVAMFSPNLTTGCPPFVITPSIINLIPSATASDYLWYANNVLIGSGPVFPGYTVVNNNDSVTIMLVAVSAYGCKNDTLRHGFKAAGTPNVNAGPDTTLCAGSVPLQLVGSPAGGRWTGSPFVALNGLFNPFTPGVYTLVYTFGSGSCIGTDTMTLTVSAGLSNNTITADQTICTGSIPSTLIGLDVTGGNGAPSYQWQSSINNITWVNISGATGKNYAPPALTQTTWYRRIASSNLCAGNTSTAVKITANPNAVAMFSPNLTSGCPPFVLTPSIINLIPSTTVSDYQWYANNVLIGSGPVFPGYTVVNNNDSVTIMLVAVSAYGCKNDTLRHGFKAAGTPNVNAGPDTTLCAGSVPLQLVGSPAGGRWTGSPFVALNGLFNPFTPGVYTLVYTFGSGSCIGTDTMTLTVSAGLSNNTITADQTICTGSIPSTLIGLDVTGGNGAPSYQWQSSVNNITWVNIAGATGKNYTPPALTQTTWYRRIASSNLCAGNTSPAVKITVNPNAVAQFSPNLTSGCPPFVLTPSIINLIPSTTVSDYQWYANGIFLGSGAVFPGYTVVNNNDSVTIMLIGVSAFGCKSDTTKHVFVAAGTPSVNAGPDTTTCAGGAPFQLVGSPIGGRWSGSALVALNGLFNPSATGTYTLVYTFGSGACIGTDTMQITVTPGITNNTIGSPQTLCPGIVPAPLIGQAIAGGGGLPAYQWQSSTNNVNWADIAGATGKDHSPGVLTQSTWFRRIASNGGCASNISAAIKISMNPAAVALFNPSVNSGCPPFTITPAIINLTTFNSVSEYQWYVNGNFLGTGVNFPGYTLTNNNDSATVMLIAVSAFGCKSDTLQHGFIAAGSPQVNAGVDTTFCNGGLPVQLVGRPAGGRWSGSVFVTVNGLFNPSTAGNYSLVYTVGSGACIATDTMVVTVAPGITGNIIVDSQTICLGTTAAQLNGQAITGGLGSPLYQWQSSTNNITWTDIPGANGLNYAPGIMNATRWFRRIANTSMCSGLQANTSNIVKITVTPDAQANFSPTVFSGCPPFTITPSIINLTPNNAAVSNYYWYANGNLLGSGSVFPGYTITNNNDSVRIMLVLISSFGCANDTSQHTFYASGTPAVNAGPDTTTCSGAAPIQLAGTPVGGRWSGSPFVSINGLFNPSVAGTYTLVYSYGSGACIGSDTMVVNVTGGVTNNLISGTQQICIGTLASTLTGQPVTGGSGIVLYQWQMSTNNVNWSNIPGATSQDYAPGVLNQTTWFRREATTSVCSGAQSNLSLAVKVTVNPNAKAQFEPLLTSSCPPFVITPSIINLTPFSAGNIEYRWYANGVQIGTGQTFPGYTIVNNQDSVTIRLIAVSSFGCKNDTLEHKFYASGTPSVNAGVDTIICHLSFPVQLIGSPAGGRWSGNFITVAGVFTPSTVGVQQLVYTYGSGTCIGRDTMLVTVSDGIINNLISGNQTICINTAASVLSGQVITGGTTAPIYQWESSIDGVTWTTIVGATGKDYNPGIVSRNTWYRRIASTSICNGLQSSISIPVKVTINPDAKAIFNPTITAGCVPFNITPTIINLVPSSNIIEYKWYVNGNYIGSGQSFPGYIMTNSNDSITIKLVAISRFGCLNDSTQHGFTSADAPSPSFTQSDSMGCGPLTVRFTNTTPNAPRYNYFWSFGNGQTSNLVQPGPINFPVAIAGGDTVYTVSMSAFTACDTITVIRRVVVRGKPKVNFLPNRGEGCSPFTVTFTNLSRASNANYTWNFGDGSPAVASNANTIQHTYTANVRTVFQVKLVGTNDCGTDSFINPIIVTPNAILVDLRTLAGDSVGCAPHIARFINSTSGASNFRWDFGDGVLLTTTNPRDTVYHTYTAPGIYNISLKAIGNCNDTTVYTRVNVKVKPVIRFTATPMLACLGDTIRFTNLSDAGTESFWRFGDGTTSYSRNPVKVYYSAGTYRVKLYGTWNNVTSSSCNDSAFVDIVIRDTMPGSFRVSDSVSSCIPFTVSFVNQSGPSANTVWNFGNGFTASGDSVVHTYTTVGTYTVRMTTRNIGGCTFADSKVIKVNAPTGTLMYNGGYACINENVRFEVRNGNASLYRFIFGDGDSLTSSSTIIFHKYTRPGRYVPYAYLIDGTCRIRISVGDTIKVDKIVAGFRSSFVRTCGITTFQFTDTSTAYYGVAGWQWDFGDGTVSPSKNPAKQYTSDGTYYVQLLVNGNSGCLDTIRVPINVSIRRAPVGNIGSDTIACTGVQMNFSALIQSQDSVANVAWNFGNNTAGIGTNVFAIYNVPGVYQVRLVTTTMYGCADTALKTIRVDATPLVNAGPDKQICRGQSTQMSVFGATSYTWSPIQGLSCVTCFNPVANPLMSTQYVVTGKSGLGCINTDTIVLNVVQPFRVTVSANDTICIGESTQLFANGASRYLWNPVYGLSSGSVANPIATPTSTTNYTVIGSDPYNCFADTGYVRVVVGPYPVVKLTGGGTVLVGATLILNSVITNGPIRSYTWTPADDLSCTTCPRPVAVINKPITYKLQVENIYGCTASDTVNYKVRCEEGLQVFIPNAFSPDGDGLNDVFMIRGKGLASVKYFRIFNRWGQMIFERSNFPANDPRSGWDGKVNGVPANPDVYVYTAEVNCAAGDTFIRKGNVTLVR